VIVANSKVESDCLLFGLGYLSSRSSGDYRRMGGYCALCSKVAWSLYPESWQPASQHMSHARPCYQFSCRGGYDVIPGFSTPSANHSPPSPRAPATRETSPPNVKQRFIYFSEMMILEIQPSPCFVFAAAHHASPIAVMTPRRDWFFDLAWNLTPGSSDT
jgi:hypothetical protein